MQDIKGVKTEMSPNVNNEVPGVGANQGCDSAGGIIECCSKRRPCCFLSET
jgi:hypothetical protein